ncbi:MAG: zinc ribbon domain-containing protein [Bacilli bacterium]|nr:zinc ribbon domain-containing protein [Bacilli bacterium]
MFCENCGFKINEGETFCTNCGNKKNAVIESTPKKSRLAGLPVSAKIGYVSRFVTLGLIASIIITIVVLVILAIASGCSGSDDACGYGILGFFIFGAIFLVAFVWYYIVVIPPMFILPTVWIKRGKNVSTTLEVFRIIGLACLYILFLLPIMVAIFSGFEGLLEFAGKILGY